MKIDSCNTSGASCLVIGGGGYIGSFLVPMLAANRKVTILGRKPILNYPLPKNTRYVQGSFSELALIQRLLDEHEDVIHLAYSTVPKTSYDNPISDLLENIPPTVQLFSEAARRGNRLVLISSGGTVYGEAISLPISEDHSTFPVSPYGLTKLTIEHYAHLYVTTHNLKLICIRPSNAYGEGQHPFMGQGFIATAMASAILGRTLTVYGEQSIRDYIHVEDIARGIVAGLDRGKLGQTYNLGSGVGLSARDVLQRIEPLLERHGYKLKMISEVARPFDVCANVLDSTTLRIHTQWQPKIDFCEGLARTFAFLTSNSHLI